jgi:glycosyltransferase involved in cell wall biosynthesis
MTSKNTINILYICAENSGGMLHYVDNLYRSMDKISNSSLYIINPNDGLNIDSFFLKKIDSISILRKVRRKYNPLRFKKLANILVNKYSPDIVHFNNYFSGARELVAEFKKMGIKTVITIHDPQPHEEKRTAWGAVHQKITNKWILPKTLKKFDAIHVHSDLHAKIMMQIYPELDLQKIYVVQHGGGVTEEIARGNVFPQELLELKSGIIQAGLFFGRIEKYKGLPFLFEAMTNVLKNSPDVKLIVAGSGDMPTIPAEISHSIISINRFIHDEEIRAIFELAKFIILPYQSGTQTGVIPLASSFSLPAITTRVGSLADLIDDDKTGIVVEPNDTIGLSIAMTRYFASPELCKEHGLNAFTFMQNNYCWEAVARLHLNEYRAISN